MSSSPDTVASAAGASTYIIYKLAMSHPILATSIQSSQEGWCERSIDRSLSLYVRLPRRRPTAMPPPASAAAASTGVKQLAWRGPACHEGGRGPWTWRSAAATTQRATHAAVWVAAGRPAARRTPRRGGGMRRWSPWAATGRHGRPWRTSLIWMAIWIGDGFGVTGRGALLSKSIARRQAITTSGICPATRTGERTNQSWPLLYHYLSYCICETSESSSTVIRVLV
jgi:hypothetical protein